jgi:hypothetical protein
MFIYIIFNNAITDLPRRFYSILTLCWTLSIVWDIFDVYDILEIIFSSVFKWLVFLILIILSSIPDFSSDSSRLIHDLLNTRLRYQPLEHIKHFTSEARALTGS